MACCIRLRLRRGPCGLGLSANRKQCQRRHVRLWQNRLKSARPCRGLWRGTIPSFVSTSLSSTRKAWEIFAGINLVGGWLLYWGYRAGIAAYLTGYVLLSPGSLVTSFLPLRSLWGPVVWRHLRVNRSRLEDLLFVPVAVIINVVVFWVIRAVRRRMRPSDPLSSRKSKRKKQKPGR